MFNKNKKFEKKVRLEKELEETLDFAVNMGCMTPSAKRWLLVALSTFDGDIENFTSTLQEIVYRNPYLRKPHLFTLCETKPKNPIIGLNIEIVRKLEG